MAFVQGETIFLQGLGGGGGRGGGDKFVYMYAFLYHHQSFYFVICDIPVMKNVRQNHILQMSDIGSPNTISRYSTMSH